MARRGREWATLGRLLINEPRAFPGALLDVVRRSVRTVWDARGGGYYAFGFVIDFVWLEINMIIDDIVEAESIADFFGEQIFELFFRYLGESFANMIKAFLWPVYVAQLSPPWGIAFLVGAYLVFARFIKKPLEQWLFDDDEPVGDDTGTS